MASSKLIGHARQRKSGKRSGLLSIGAAASAVLAGGISAKANINGFAGFAAVNSNISDTNLGYQSSNTAFVLTDSQNSEATSGFNIIPQSISGGFVATYDYVGTGSADGVTLAFLNPAVGSTTTLGNPGGSLGYAGSGTNSAAVGIEGYGSSAAEFTNGGNEQQTALNGGINVFNGDTYHVTDVYSGSTFTQNIVDLTTGAAGSQKTYSLNLATTLGSSTALVGFTGGTGGLNSTQTVKNFSFSTGNLKYSPIAVTGYDYAGIITVAGGTAAVTATMDAGTLKTGDTWFEKGWSTNLPNAGLPTSGSTFVSQEDTNHTFTMPSYAGNDVILLSNTVATGTFNFSTPAAYTALSFLTATGNGPGVFNATVNYANGKSSTDQVLVSPDWFNGQPSAFSAGGRATLMTAPNNAENDGTNPNLYQDDIFLTDTTDPISSVTFNYNRGGGVMIFAVSGSATNLSPVLTYTGNQSAGVFDSTHYNFYNGTNTNFSNGSIVLFDDTSASTTTNRNISVASGLSIGGLTFNNSTATLPYVFTGSGLGGSGGLTMNGNGTVIFDNPNTFTGDTDLEAGQLVIGSGGTFNSSNILVATGANLNVAGGTLTNASINLTNYGSFNFSGTTLTVASFNGSGPLASSSPTGTKLSVTGSGTYTGAINLNGGSFFMNGSGQTVTLTGADTIASLVLQSGTLLVNSTVLGGTGTINGSGGAIGSASGTTNATNQIIGAGLNVSSGSNTFEISNAANTFTGPLNVVSGYLQFDNAGSLGHATVINVSSGASVIVNDSTGTAGLGKTIILSGPGVTANPTALPFGSAADTGALQGPYNSSSAAVWAGNINVSGGGSIAAGGNGLFEVTGSIIGTGPLVLTASPIQPNGTGSELIIAPSGTNANTYGGETQIQPGVTNTSVGMIVQLGAPNGFSPNAGLNILQGVEQAVTVDLNGYNQSVQYLTGYNTPTYQLTSSTGLSTLTITSGLKGGVAQEFATSITGNVAVVMTGSGGTQILSGNNSYTGGTTITAGTLGLRSFNAAGTGAISLNGGTLRLATSLSAGTPIVGSTNFTNSSFAFNVSPTTSPLPTFSGNTLTLTAGTNGTATSAFYTTPVTVSDKLGFTASFTYSVPSGYADGMAFVLQNDPRGTAALGGGGGEVGYGGGAGVGITNSAAVILDIYSFGYNGGRTAFDSGGTAPGDVGDTVNFQSTYPVNFALYGYNGAEYGDNADANINVTLVYNGLAKTLTETLINTVENETFTTVYTGVDYSALVGGAANGSTTAYVGFTGGEGGISSVQNISNFTYATNLSAPTSIGNAIIANPNTSSQIQMGITTGTTSSLATVGPITIGSNATIAVVLPAGLTGGGRGVLSPASLSIAPTGRLDLGSNDLDLTSSAGSTISQVTKLVASGYNNGNWNGSGIASSAAAADSTHLTALGVLINDTTANTSGSLSGTALYSTLDGAAVADGDILVKYTYYGDTNLDGKVDGTDYSRIDNGYISKLTGWANGDFNYDGVINGSDYTLIDNAYNTQGASLNEASAQVAAATAEVAGATSAVPEPATLGLIGIGAMGLLSRRRRRI